MKKVWFITGASKGFGLLLVQQLLEKGEKVAVTSRNKKELEQLVPASDNFLALEVDLVNEDSVNNAIVQTVSKFGQLDVVINNAGYGLVGGLEELSDKEARGNFDVNVFGSLNVIRQAMQILREQRSGHVINIASVGGYLGDFPGFGIYCATKFAVVGFTESLAAEIAGFGIHATVVLPGYFRTNFLNSGSLITAKNPIDAYESTRASQKVHQEEVDLNQPGDPEKGAAKIISIAFEAKPPLHLFLGSDAYGFAKDKAGNMMAELEDWKHVTVSTDF